MNRRLLWPRLKSYPIGDCEEPGVAKFMDVHNGLPALAGPGMQSRCRHRTETVMYPAIHHQSVHPAPALPIVRRMVLAALIRLLPQRLRMHQVVTPGTAVPPPCGHRQMDLSAPDRPWPGGRAATAIRPAHRADLAALRDFFAGLSARTRYLRFFGPVTPSSALLQELCGLADTIDAVIAIRGGVIVGHAMAADRTDPRGTRVTDIGVVVADAWQGRRLGSALMRALVTRAQARGVTLLEMDVLDGNRQVLDMITSHWPAACIGHSQTA